VDGQTSRILDPVGVSWNVLLPACDGDVSDLQGVKPYDRSLLITNESNSLNKSSFEVFGANHNFYNTEWQESDASGCQGQTALFPQFKGSKPQRTTASETLIPFFRAHLGPSKAPKLARRFDPSYPLSVKLTNVTAYARGFMATPRASQNFIVDNFNNATGTSSAGVPNQSSGLTQYLHGAASSSHDVTQRAAAVKWSSPGGFLQVNVATAGNSVDVSGFKTLEFRVALRCFGSLCSSSPNPTGDIDFSIALANGNGTLSAPITLKSVAVVRRPVGDDFTLNSILQTVRVPFADFSGADITHFRGVRFTFNQTSASSIFLANVRLTRGRAGPGGLSAAAEASAGPVRVAMTQSETNRIVAIRRVASVAGRAVPGVEIELSSTRAFPIGDALPTLTIGGRSFTLSRFGSGKADSLVFMLEAGEYAVLKDGADVMLEIGGARPWSFGALRK